VIAEENDEDAGITPHERRYRYKPMKKLEKSN